MGCSTSVPRSAESAIGLPRDRALLTLLRLHLYQAYLDAERRRHPVRQPPGIAAGRRHGPVLDPAACCRGSEAGLVVVIARRSRAEGADAAPVGSRERENHRWA